MQQSESQTGFGERKQVCRQVQVRHVSCNELFAYKSQNDLIDGYCHHVVLSGAFNDSKHTNHIKYLLIDLLPLNLKVYVRRTTPEYIDITTGFSLELNLT